MSFANKDTELLKRLTEATEAQTEVLKIQTGAIVKQTEQLKRVADAAERQADDVDTLLRILREAEPINKQE